MAVESVVSGYEKLIGAKAQDIYLIVPRHSIGDPRIRLIKRHTVYQKSSPPAPTD